MLPHKEVIDGDVGKLWLGSIRSQESQPVLCGNNIVRVDGGLGQLQDIQELLQLFGGQRVNVLPHHRGFPLVAVWPRPAKFTLATVVTCKVTCSTEEQLWAILMLMLMMILPLLWFSNLIQIYSTHQHICKSGWRIWSAISLCHQHFSVCTVLPRVCCRLEPQSRFLSRTESHTH